MGQREVEENPICPICKDLDAKPIETMLKKKISLVIKIGDEEHILKLSLYICPKCRSYFAW